MQYLPYLGIVVVAFLGNLAGMVLGAISPEEVVPGRRWLLLLKKVIYLLLIAALLYYHHSLLQSAAILVIGGMGYLHHNYRIVYALFGALLGILFYSPALLPAAALIFLFGLPAGSLVASTRRKERLPTMLRKSLKQMWWLFFPLALLLPLILRFLPSLLAYL